MNKIKFLMLSTIVTLAFTSCVYRESTYPAHVFLLKLECQYNLSVIAGEVKKLYDSNGVCFYKVDLERVNGGDALLFGIWEMSNSDGHEAKRIVVNEGSKEVSSYSINDLKASSQDTIDIMHLKF